MSLLDGLHAAVTPGETFVWLHSIATFAGGVLFASCWLPQRAKASVSLVSFGGLALFSLAGIVGIVQPDWMPQMVSDGEFTASAVVLNIGGGILMSLAAVKLAISYFETENPDDLLFAVHCMLFGGAAILFEWSVLWDFTWWWWHILRLVAYAVAFAFAIQALDHLRVQAMRQEVELRNQCQNAKARALQAITDSENLPTWDRPNTSPFPSPIFLVGSSTLTKNSVSCVDTVATNY